MKSLRQQIEEALNNCSAENMSNTPDFILAQYLINCLDSFDIAVRSRDDWYRNLNFQNAKIAKMA